MGLGRESVVRWDVGKDVESEVRGIGGWRWNWVFPDSMHFRGIPTKRKCALTFSNLSMVVDNLAHSQNHDDLLFMAMLLTGFFTLMQLDELCFSNDIKLWNWKKITKRSSVIITKDQYKFHLSSHKANCFFEGNYIIVKKQQYCDLNPLSIFCTYLTPHNSKFPLSLPLWLTSKGTIPTHHFFISCMHHYFDHDIAGQSMRVGGTTSLAEHSVPPSLIQLMGQWSSQAFLIYIKKTPHWFKPPFTLIIILT